MKAIDWPLWQSGRELGAEHLLGLEDFLLSRHHFEGSDWGVEKMALNSVQIIVDEKDVRVNKIHVTVNEISGLTPSGRPVIVDPDHPIKQQTLDFKLSSKDSLNVVLRFNDRLDKANTSPVGTKDSRTLPLDSKISIHAELDSTLQHRQSLQTKANSLFLGTYAYERNDKGGETRLIHKPRVRSLGVLENFLGRKEWKEWTQSLVTELAALLAQHSRLNTTAAAHLSSQQLLLALYRWKQLSVVEWTQLADILRWAAQLQPQDWQSHAYDNTESTNTDDWQGDDLPKNIIALLQGLLEQKTGLGDPLIKGVDYEYTQIRGGDIIIKLSSMLKGRYLCLGISTLCGTDAANLPQLTQPDNHDFTPWEGKKTGKKPNDGYWFHEIKVDPQFEYVVKNIAANDKSEVKLYKQSSATGEIENVEI